MSNLYIQAQTLTDIADAIRDKTGAGTTMTPSQMASAIGSISGGGEELDNFIENGVGEVYENSRITKIAKGTFAYTDIISVNFSNVISIKDKAFQYCSSLTTISFPVTTSIGNYAFAHCDSLNTANFPNVTTIGNSAFYHCDLLTTVNFSAATSIGVNAFTYCSALTTAIFPNVTYIRGSAFRNCYNLLSLYLLGSSIPTLTNTYVFISTPISNYTTSTGGIYGSIYVPASLYDSYITATNWATYSSRFVSV